MNTGQLGVHAPVVLPARRLKMGRSGGCCLPANCTAPPCPSGSCCYVDTSKSINLDTFSVQQNLDYFICEDEVTENCCLAKPFSLFNKTNTCGDPILCGDQPSVAMPFVANTDKAFALLKQDGSVFCWGDRNEGGSTPPLLVYPQLSHIVNIFANPVAFVGLKKDSSAVDWGHETKGGSPSIELVDIKHVVGSAGAFAAIKTDGTVIAWGEAEYGGSIPSSISSLLVNIIDITSTDKYFAARDEDGTVFIWGNGEKAYDRRDVNKSGSVTTLDSLQVLNHLQRNDPYSSLYDVNRSGSVTSSDSLEIANYLALESPIYDSGFTNINKVYANKNAFAFLDKNGNVYVWGDEDKGGDTKTKHPELTNVKQIYNTDEAFLALRKDGKIVVWGEIDTTAGPTSDFYDEVLDVYPSKYAFGLSYLKANQNSYIINGQVFIDTTSWVITQYFSVIGSIVRGKPNLAENVSNVSGPFSLGDSSGPQDKFNFKYQKVYSLLPLLSDQFQAAKIKKDFYASNYAFHFNYNAGLTLVGNSPDDKHDSHTLKYTGKSGSIDSDNYKLVRNPAVSSVRIKNAKNYAFTDRATAFLVTGDTGGQKQGRFREGLFYSPDYVVSIGNTGYGGLGSSFLTWGNYGNSVKNKGQFVGIFSNKYAFCAIRFINRDENTGLPVDPTFEIVNWGWDVYGGREVYTSQIPNAFSSTSDLKVTYQGCHPSFCDQDIT